MKKLLCLLLALAMVFSLCACDSSDEDDKKKDDSSDKEDSTVTFEEMTVVDNDECTIKITGIDPDNRWGFTLEVYLENKSEDTTYTFWVEEATVNGVQNDPYFYADVEPGQNTKEEISFSDEDLAEIIGTFTDIALKFEVSDSEDWMAEPVVETKVHVYPYGEEKAAVYVREPKDTDTVLVDNEDVTLIVTGYEYDEIWGYCVKLYHVNKTDSRVMFSADDVSVNGYMCDPYYAHTVIAGAISFSSISWMDTEFAENGITQVRQIEMVLRVYDDEDWSAEDIVNESVTLTPDLSGDVGTGSGDNQEPGNSFDELVVADNEECTIKITDVVEDDLWGLTVKVYLENKSSDTTYHFAVNEATVNGVENSPYFGVDIAPGKKSNEEIYFFDEGLEEIIGAFTDIKLVFQVCDAEDWFAEPVLETAVHVYPQGEENATIYERVPQDTDIVLADNAYVTVIAIGCVYDEIWGHSVELFLVNKTDTEVMFSTEDVAVNGILCDPYFACSVNAGNCAFASMSWFSSDFEANGITRIEKVEMRLRVYDNENWMNDDFVNENVTLVP